MTANINKIFTNSVITVNNLSQAILCFSDGKALPRAQFTVTDVLSIRTPANEELSLFYSNNIAQTYEFEVSLHEPNIQLGTLDKNYKIVERLHKSGLLVFVDGILQQPSEYTILDEKILMFNNAYTNNVNKKFNVILYMSNTQILRETIVTKPTVYTLEGAIDSGALQLDNLQIDYNPDTMIFFKNGLKIPRENITVSKQIDPVTDTVTNNSLLTINVSTDDLRSLEYVCLEPYRGDDNTLNTISVSFKAHDGYISYGPFDDYNKHVPILYDTKVTFSEKASLAVDNLRTGFFIKEANGIGELLVVDDNFDKAWVRCAIITPFKTIRYEKDQYYLTVPSATTIVKYLAEYDKKFTFLPEVLTIFQRLLLDEINDSIQRLRDSRSLSKVDSVNINKLISLLGFNLNIKELTLKQRHELLEELNEFYRRAGTRDSYNMVNILQDDLKLIAMEQLFTPHYPQSQGANVLFRYNPEVIASGTGYKVNDLIKLEGTDVKATLTAVTETGGIIKDGIRFEAKDGTNQYNGTYEIVSGIDGQLSCTSTPVEYKYHWEVTGSNGYKKDQRITTIDNQYSLTITEVNSKGEILDGVLSISTGPLAISTTALETYLDSGNDLNLTIATSYPDTNKTILVKDSNRGGATYSSVLYKGRYKITMSGGGGSGGAADSTSGNNCDWPATAGKPGEKITVYVNVDRDGTPIYFKVGQGGGKVKARGHDAWPQWETLGDGYYAGTNGEGTRVKWTHHRSWPRRDQHYAGCAVAGQGGGATGIKIGDKVYTARGGNGGSATVARTGQVLTGGIGGGGGVNAGTGAAGGNRNTDNSSFWSGQGADGYIIIEKIQPAYTLSVSGDSSVLGGGEQFISTNSPITFSVTATKANNNVTFTTTPTAGTITYDNHGEIVWNKTYVVINDTFKLASQTTNTSAKLNISSEIIKYEYDLTFSGATDTLHKGNEFLISIDGVDLKYVVIDNDHGETIPLFGTKYIEFQRKNVSLETGSDARIQLSSERISQSVHAEEYIDFAKREELGAVFKRKELLTLIDYGTVTEGTPKSPSFWLTGLPDIEYGTVTEGTPNSPDFTHTGIPDINYGVLDDGSVKQWQTWWQWDRNPQWYPTNHVELELKMPLTTDFEGYTNRFIEQFYEMASAVIYIHRLIQAFYVGKDVTIGDSVDPYSGAPIGIITAAPYITQWVVATSDPSIQIRNKVI